MSFDEFRIYLCVCYCTPPVDVSVNDVIRPCYKYGPLDRWVAVGKAIKARQCTLNIAGNQLKLEQ